VTTPTDLHPADQASAERIARAIGRDDSRCEHGLPPRSCLVCIGLTHAEKTSVAVRAAYAAGDWSPYRYLRHPGDCPASTPYDHRPGDPGCVDEPEPAPHRIRGLRLGGLSRRLREGAAL
jgi:hypothetical protein